MGYRPTQFSTQNVQCVTGFGSKPFIPYRHNPYAAGTLDIIASVGSGMDTSRMDGVNPACLNVVAGTAVITQVEVLTKSPINPKIRITIGTAGTLTAIQLLGKMFSTSVRNFAAEASDPTSIIANGICSTTISSPWILNNGIAAIIANAQLADYKDETKLLDGVKTTIQFSSQMGDRVNCVDKNTGISADYWVVGLHPYYSKSQMYIIYKLWKIPAGM